MGGVGRSGRGEGVIAGEHTSVYNVFSSHAREWFVACCGVEGIDAVGRSRKASMRYGVWLQGSALALEA